MDAFGTEHPERHMAVYEVPQIAGTLRRSRPIRGAAESLLTTKRYLATLLVLQPAIVVVDWIVYEKRGKWVVGRDAVPVNAAFLSPGTGSEKTQGSFGSE
jgi:hypothetical protein